MRIPAGKKIAPRLFAVLLAVCAFFQWSYLFPVDVWNNPPEFTTLSNGIPLVYHFDDTSEVTVVQIMILGGSRAEPPGKEGLSYLTTRLMLEIPDDLKLRRLMGQATRLSMVSESDYSLISIASLSDNVKEALNVMTDIMYSPLFSGIRISSLKNMMNAQRESSADDPGNIATIGQLDRLFFGTAYSGSTFGSKNSLKSIKKKDIDAFYDTYFRTNNLRLIVTSDLSQTQITELCETYLTKVPEGTADIPALAEKQPADPGLPQEIHLDVQQHLISYAYPLDAASHDNVLRTELLETLLGQGIGSRLWPLRAEEKLAYNVAAVSTQMKEGGLLEIYLETDESKLAAAEQSLLNLLDDLLKEGITEEELAMTKTYVKAAFLRHNENKISRAWTFSAFLSMGFDVGFLQDYFRFLDEVSLEEMNDFIRRVLDPSKRSRIIVGPEPSGDFK
jgi:zinc protease